MLIGCSRHIIGRSRATNGRTLIIGCHGRCRSGSFGNEEDTGGRSESFGNKNDRLVQMSSDRYMELITVRPHMQMVVGVQTHMQEAVAETVAELRVQTQMQDAITELRVQTHMQKRP